MVSDPEVDLDPAFFAEMVETVGVGVAIYGEEGRYLYVNDAYAGLFDVDPEALVGTPIWEIVARFDADRFEGYWRSFDTGETRRAETVHEYDGTAVPVATVTTQRTIDGTPYHFGTIKDITERKEREREIRRQNERLDTFASVVSHDLRNPLNVAQGYLEMLARDVDREEISRVEGALDRMDELITELLALARNGEEISHTEPTSVTEASQAAWDTVTASDAALSVPEPDIVIDADQSRLRQLFENLFRNAVEHGGEGLAVTVGPIEGGFYVADDGTGIPPDLRDQVFSAGYTTDDEGTGFGLNIVERIADGHGWDVCVTESDDGGAQFVFTGVSVAE